MDYRLKVFCCVADLQSISAAAKKLRISQPAVTQHIKMLEESYSCTFFLRSRTGVSLTEAGATLLGYARRIAALDEEVATKLRNPESHLGGHLRLGVSTTIIQYYLPKVLAEFKQRHAAVSIQVVESNSMGVISALLAQRIDIGLIESPCRRRDLRAESFFDDEIVVIISPGDPLAKKRFIGIEEFSRQSFVFRELGSGTRQCFEESLQRLKMNIKKLSIVQEFSSTETIKRAVAEGMGLGFVSRISITNELANGSLSILKVRGLEIRRHFSTILPLGPDPVGLRQVFLTFLR